MRIREPKTTALIFASGKMVVTGAKSEDDSKLASRKYARIIQKLGFNAKFTDFKIQNIVGSCDIKFPIRLEGLASKHHNFSSYEPELFPGLIYRMIKPKIVLLIFVSGKIVLTGAKVREEIYQAFEMIYPVLQGELQAERFSISSSGSVVPNKGVSRFPQGLNLGNLGHHAGVCASILLPDPATATSSTNLSTTCNTITLPSAGHDLRLEKESYPSQAADRCAETPEILASSVICIICVFLFPLYSIASAFTERERIIAARIFALFLIPAEPPSCIGSWHAPSRDIKYP